MYKSETITITKTTIRSIKFYLFLRLFRIFLEGIYTKNYLKKKNSINTIFNSTKNKR